MTKIDRAVSLLTLAWCGLLSLAPVTTQAATFNVSKTADSATPGIDCTTGACSLREAIIAANATTEADTINLAAGTYALTITGDDDTGAVGDLDITRSLTILGAASDTTIIDGSSVANRIFHLVSPLGNDTSTVVINGVTVQNGTVDANKGGGMYIGKSVIAQMKDVKILNNSATNAGGIDGMGIGGGIYCDGRLTLENGTIRGNSADARQVQQQARFGGGGLFIDGNGDADLINVVVAANSSNNTYPNPPPPISVNFATGGGILNMGKLLVRRGSIVGGSSADKNTSLSGAGIANIGGFLTVSDSVVSFNETLPSVGAAEDGRTGGGIYNQNADVNKGNLVITGSTISDNFADKQGGGVFTAGIPLTLSNSTIARNRATFIGGGIATVGQIAVDIVNSTVTENVAIDAAGSKGGGLYTSSRVSINASTFHNNVAVSGSQIFASTQAGSTNAGSTPDPDIGIENSLLTADTNADSICGDDDATASFIHSRGYNLESGSACFSTLGFNDAVNQAPADVYETGTLAKNPPTVAMETIAIKPAPSPAAEARELNGCPSTDQRFYRRMNLCDKGAYEADGQPGASSDTLADLKITIKESADKVFTGSSQLTYTLTVTNIGPNAASQVLLQPIAIRSIVNGQSLSTGFTVTDKRGLDPGITVDCTNDVSPADISCAIGDIPAFQTRQVSISLQPSQVGEIKITATVGANPDGDYFKPNNTATETTTVAAGGGPSNPAFPNSGGGGLVNLFSLVGLASLLGFRWRQRIAQNTARATY